MILPVPQKKYSVVTIMLLSPLPNLHHRPAMIGTKPGLKA